MIRIQTVGRRKRGAGDTKIGMRNAANAIAMTKKTAIGNASVRGSVTVNSVIEIEKGNANANVNINGNGNRRSGSKNMQMKYRIGSGTHTRTRTRTDRGQERKNRTGQDRAHWALNVDGTGIRSPTGTELQLAHGPRTARMGTLTLQERRLVDMEFWA